MNRNASRWSRLLATTAIALAAGSFAYSQEPQSEEPPDGEARVLNQVVVTATRRAASLQDVPVSVSVVSDEQLARTGTVSTSDLPSLAPGLYFSPGTSTRASQFIIRGVGTFSITNALETSVGVAIDGAPIARATGQVADMIDVERVEVLKGPQGTLFGKNATAGVIAITTRQPSLGETSTRGNVSYGSYNQLNMDVAQNMALGDSAALRIAAWRASHEGFIDSATESARYGNSNSGGLRVGLKLAPTDDFTYTIIGQYDGRDERSVIQTVFDFGVTAPGFIARVQELGITPSLTNRTADSTIPAFGRADNYSLTGIGDYELGSGHVLSSLTSYRQMNSELQQNPFGLTNDDAGIFITVTGTEESETISQEFRLASPDDGPLSYVLGLYYYQFEVEDKQGQFGSVRPRLVPHSTMAPQNIEQVNYAVFAEGTYRVLPNFRLLAGIRQSKDKVDGVFSRYELQPPVGVPLPSISPFFVDPEEVEYDFTSYRVGAQYDVTPDIMVYATASRGYKGPGFNFSPTLSQAEANQFGVNVDAETVQAYEAGLKGRFFSNRASLNLAVFHSEFEDFQATVAVSTNPLVYSVRNAGALESRGFEFDIEALLADDLTVGLSGAYTDATFTDFAGPCYGGQPSLPAGSPLTPGFCVGGLQTLNGDRMPQAPEWVLNGRLSYERDVGADWRAYFTGDVRYTSEVTFEANNDPRNVQGAYSVANATIGFGPQDGNWRLSLYARNIFDESFALRRRESAGVYQQFLSFESVRRVGAMLSFDF